MITAILSYKIPKLIFKSGKEIQFNPTPAFKAVLKAIISLDQFEKKDINSINDKTVDRSNKKVEKEALSLSILFGRIIFTKNDANGIRKTEIINIIICIGVGSILSF